VLICAIVDTLPPSATKAGAIYCIGLIRDIGKAREYLRALNGSFLKGWFEYDTSGRRAALPDSSSGNGLRIC